MNTIMSIREVLHDIAIPNVMQDGVSHTVVAPAAYRKNLRLPEKMTVKQAPIVGQRRAVYSSRPYGAGGLVDAVWSEDNLHSARAPVLCMITKGPLIYRIADYKLCCEAGHSILIPPGVPFANGSYQFLDTTKPNDGSCSMLQMQAYREGLCCWQTFIWLDHNQDRSLSEQNNSIHGSKVPEYIHLLLETMILKHDYWRIICDSILRLLLATLYNELQDLPSFDSGSLFSPNKQNNDENPIIKIEKYIQQNLQRDLSTDKMAQRAFMSRAAFTKHFRIITGKSLGKYVTDLRFQKACLLLKGTDLAVGQVAGAVGIEPDRLRVLFRQRKGIPPSSYRRRQQKNK